MASKRYINSCVYCGQRRPLTDDHIPPKSLFATDRTNLLTVKCCDECHQGTSEDDEQFRLFLSLDITTAKHPDAAAQLDKILRSLSHAGQTGFRRDFLDSVRPINVVSNTGTFMFETGMYAVSADALRRVVQRIVRGLHYKEFEERLPTDTVFTIQLYRDILKAGGAALEVVHNQLLPAFSQGPGTVIGNNVFGYKGAKNADRKYSSAWLLAFYGQIVIIALAHAPGKYRFRK